jgi:ADP-heptose:LPS heptosyltransferase
MIFNIAPGTFGGPVRNGDMIGIINVIQHLRKSIPDTQFHMLPGTINESDYCQKFFSFLCNFTDFFSVSTGKNDLLWRNVNLWDFRDISGDVVSIKNETVIKDKLVVFPLFDAPYNCYRNWPIAVFSNILKEFSNFEGEKIICADISPDTDLHGFNVSTDFLTNIHHILDCKIFVGGDTGTSHFASALDRGPQRMIYYYSSRGLLHTTPFHVLKGKGELRTYWLDFEKTSW